MYGEITKPWEGNSPPIHPITRRFKHNIINHLCHLRVKYCLNFIGTAIVLILFSACNSSPTPPEIKSIKYIDLELNKIDADKYAPLEYDKFRKDFKNLNDKLIQEKSRFSWFRDYKEIQKNFNNILNEGSKLLKAVREKREVRKEIVYEKIKRLENRAKIIDNLTLKINAGTSTRKRLTLGRLAIDEARVSFENGIYDSAIKKTDNAASFLAEAEKAIIPLIKRYSHNNLIEKWKRIVKDTIEESKTQKTTAIIVNKVEQTLALYKDGKTLLTFDIGLGKNGYRDKLFSGDGATPEGRYRVIKKLGEGESKYYKALLLDYPNQEDRKEFLNARKKGVISKRTGIGSLIEIHGGGKDGSTRGCIALDNYHIDELFERVNVGTSVTIVGATTLENELNYGLKLLESPL